MLVMPSVAMLTWSAGPLRFTRGTSSVKEVEPVSTVIWIVTVTSVPSGDAVVVIWLPVKLCVIDGGVYSGLRLSGDAGRRVRDVQAAAGDGVKIALNKCHDKAPELIHPSPETPAVYAQPRRFAT